MTFFSNIQLWLRQYKILPPLSYDQQVWGAKSLMDLYQPASFFYMSDADQGGTMLTLWRGSQDGVTYKITVDVDGQSTGPTKCNNPNVIAFGYPPLYSCAQAGKMLVKAGITEAWLHCTLEQLTNGYIMYYFTFHQHAAVTVDAMTGEIITICE